MECKGLFIKNSVPASAALLSVRSCRCRVQGLQFRDIRLQDLEFRV